jgi:hypothetical protein
MLNLEGTQLGEVDNNSVYSISKNDDMPSLNFSSIQPYNRDEPLNTDFVDWTGSNFLVGQDLCYPMEAFPGELPYR